MNSNGLASVASHRCGLTALAFAVLIGATLLAPTPAAAHGSEADEQHAHDASDVWALAHGGRLYDKWFKVIKAETPKVVNPSYPDDGKYKGKKGADWRCKECHGWDHLGKDGAYAKGKHFTGFKGIQAFKGADPEKIVATLKDKVHGYTDDMMSAQDFRDLALFVSVGQVDMDKYIERASKKAKGDVAKGKGYYDTICANCHGFEGTKVKDMPPMGKVASGNPWEALHKIVNGQPGEEMPALRALDIQISVDALAYAQTLPKEK